MNNLKSFYKNKKVIITGHTGFKGSWLTEWLKTYNAKIFGVAIDIPTIPSNFKASKVFKEIKQYRLDIRERKKIIDLFIKIKPDYVFHLAAQSLVKKSFNNPSLTWSTNLIGTLNVLEALKNLKNRCVSVIITSDKCYLNKEINRGYKESDILGGNDPYSASKASAEILINSYVKSFFQNTNSPIRIVSVRAGNVIGGGDWSEDRLIPDCVKRWSKNKVVTIRNPNSTRPWQHVLEAIYGYILVAAKLKKNKHLHGESFNFGPSKKENRRVLILLKAIKIFWPNVKWKVKEKRNFKESGLLKLNSEKVKKMIKWKSILTFQETIKFTVQWYKCFYFSKNINQLTKPQIDEYKNLLVKRQIK
jgi:CDP-glucose 4,6-dehydratase